MDLQVNIDPESINEAVKQAIIKSSIGKALAEEIEKQVARLTQSWDNPLAPLIRQEINKVVIDAIRNEHLDKIRDTVKQKITDQLISDLTESAWDALIKKVENY